MRPDISVNLQRKPVYDRPSLQKRCILTAVVLCFYQLIRSLPLPWLSGNVGTQTQGLEAMITGLLGNDSTQRSLFALGITPWMSASILLMFFSFLTKGFRNSSRKSRRRTTLILTFFFSVLYGFSQIGDLGLFPWQDKTTLLCGLSTLVAFIAGAFFTVFLGEKLQKDGLGGPSGIILTNILASLPGRLIQALPDQENARRLAFTAFVFWAAILVIVTILMESEERHVPLWHVMLHSEYAGESSMAISINPAGMMPMMFAMTAFYFPVVVLRFLFYLFPVLVNMGGC